MDHRNEIFIGFLFFCSVLVVSLMANPAVTTMARRPAATYARDCPCACAMPNYGDPRYMICAQGRYELKTFLSECHMRCHNRCMPGEDFAFREHGECHDIHRQTSSGHAAGNGNTVVPTCKESKSCICSKVYSPVCAYGPAKEMIRFYNLCQLECTNRCFHNSRVGGYHLIEKNGACPYHKAPSSQYIR